jgi:CRP/FNR family transcriptional regulator
MKPTADQISATLRRVAIFGGLSEVELRSLVSRIQIKSYGRGEEIFCEGDACRGLFIVHAGAVKIFKSSPEGREQVLTVEQPGGSIAELPVFDGGAYPACAAAVEDSTLLFVDKNDFYALCRQHPELSLKVLRVVGGRLRRLVNIIEELSFTTVRHRLARVLWELVERAGKTAKDSRKAIEITLPYSHQELANQIGTVRELVSRNLSRLEAQGILRVAGRVILVLDPEALRAATLTEK